MKKSYQITGGIATLILGILFLGADRLFVSAEGRSYINSMTVLTTVALFFFLIGAIWLFKTTFK